MSLSQPSPGESEIVGLTNEELACQAQVGSSDCFAELVKRYEGRLLHFLTQRTQHQEDAEDLLQETFARAYRKIHRYNPRWKFSTWLFTIASRLASNQWRRSNRSSLDYARLLPAETASPSSIISQREEKENLWGLAAEVLSKSQYTALWLRYVEGMLVKEIAKVMRKTQNHVKVLLFRGRSLLAQNLGCATRAERLSCSNANSYKRCAYPTNTGGR